jgi:hypothetical protein
MKAREKNETKFAVCITDSEPDLELRKVYKVLPDEVAAKDHHLRIVDESGEDYLYPSTFFVFVEVPSAGEREKILMAEVPSIDPKQKPAMARKSLRAARGALVVKR